MTHRDSSVGWIWAGSMVALLSLGVAVVPVRAQGAMTGRVSIQERAGESTNDLSSTVIYLVPRDSASVRPHPMRTNITMNGRAFVPRVRVVTPGSRVDFPNQDPFSHNIFSSTAGATFDLGLYPAGKAKDAPFRRPGAYPIYCNIHPRMTSYVVVAPTPWFAQVGNDGRWVIDSVPAGHYSMVVWHERAKTVTSEIEVPVGGLANLASALDARGFKFVEHKNKFGKEYDKSGKDRY